VKRAWTDYMLHAGEERTRAKIVVKQLDILETRAEAQLRQDRRGSYNSNNNGIIAQMMAMMPHLYDRSNSHGSSAERRQSNKNQRNRKRHQIIIEEREDLLHQRAG